MSKSKKSRKTADSSDESDDSSSSDPSSSESSSDDSSHKRKHKKRSKKLKKHKSKKQKVSESEDESSSGAEEKGSKKASSKKHKKHKKKRSKHQDSDSDVKIQETEKVMYISSGDDDKYRHDKRDKRLDIMKKLRGPSDVQHDEKDLKSKWDSPADEQDRRRGAKPRHHSKEKYSRNEEIDLKSKEKYGHRGEREAEDPAAFKRVDDRRGDYRRNDRVDDDRKYLDDDRGRALMVADEEHMRYDEGGRSGGRPYDNRRYSNDDNGWKKGEDDRGRQAGPPGGHDNHNQFRRNNRFHNNDRPLDHFNNRRNFNNDRNDNFNRRPFFNNNTNNFNARRNSDGGGNRRNPFDRKFNDGGAQEERPWRDNQRSNNHEEERRPWRDNQRFNNSQGDNYRPYRDNRGERERSIDQPAPRRDNNGGGRFNEDHHKRYDSARKDLSGGERKRSPAERDRSVQHSEKRSQRSDTHSSSKRDHDKEHIKERDVSRDVSRDKKKIEADQRSPSEAKHRDSRPADRKQRRYPKHESDSEKHEWGKRSKHSTDKSPPPAEKEKPNFGLSGKLTEDTNKVNGVVIKYSEPEESRKPRRRWRLYPFKGEQSLQTLYIHRQSCYLIGRDRKICDIPIDHPSCSKQHAALQYRMVPYKKEDGTASKRVRPYVLDMDSANGTFVNNKKIEPKKYVELLEKDVIKFGFSSREYVLLHENSKDEELDDDVMVDEADVKSDNAGD